MSQIPRNHLHPEVQSALDLILVQQQKIYFSSSLLYHVNGGASGSSHQEEWNDAWVQLTGTTLRIMDMKAGDKAPAIEIDVKDSIVQEINSSRQYATVFKVNADGSNFILFSCPSPRILASWVNAIRLAAWEKSRLEEIYTASLIRISLTMLAVEPHNILEPGSKDDRKESWVQICTTGSMKWHRVWAIISTPSASNISYSAAPLVTFHKSSLFANRKSPLLSFHNITQAYGVYPGQPELVMESTLIKVEGRYGDGELAGGMKGKGGWLLIMPDVKKGQVGASVMLTSIMAIHDAFSLCGRPKGYTWNPHDPISLMFAYPFGPHREELFLSSESAGPLDHMEHRTSITRAHLRNILLARMRRSAETVKSAISAPMDTSSPSTGPVDFGQALPPYSVAASSPAEPENPASDKNADNEQEEPLQHTQPPRKRTSRGFRCTIQ